MVKTPTELQRGECSGRGGTEGSQEYDTVIEWTREEKSLVLSVVLALTWEIVELL